MSVERVERKSGAVWRVRWRDETGGPRSKVIGRKADAIHFDAEIRRLKRTGELGQTDKRRTPVNELVELWWESYALPHLSQRSRETYASMWNLHIRPVIGDLPCGQVTTEHGDEIVASLVAKDLAPLTVNKVMSLASQVLRWGADRGYLTGAPFRPVKRPAQKVKRKPRVLTIEEIELLRSKLDQRGQLIVGLMAYGGVRPAELRRLTREHVRDGVIRLPEGVCKLNTPPRRVEMIDPLAEDVEQWLSDTEGRMLVTSRTGGEWRVDGYVAWVRNHFHPAAPEDVIPYDLRHSYVSLQIQSGVQILEVARRAGHRPVETLGTYGHLFEEYDPAQRLDIEAEITRCREKLVSE